MTDWWCGTTSRTCVFVIPCSHEPLFKRLSMTCTARGTELHQILMKRMHLFQGCNLSVFPPQDSSCLATTGLNGSIPLGLAKPLARPVRTLGIPLKTAQNPFLGNTVGGRESRLIKENQTKSHQIKPAGWWGEVKWPVVSGEWLPATPPGQTQSNPVKPAVARKLPWGWRNQRKKENGGRKKVEAISLRHSGPVKPSQTQSNQFDHSFWESTLV
jgi:hypothetical protein